MAQDKIYWEDEYAKKHPNELTSYATCIVDGYKWRVREVKGSSPIGNLLQTYCAGKAKERGVK